MTFEDWLGTLEPKDKEIYIRLVQHNLSLIKGHNGCMYVSNEFLSGESWRESRYHFASKDYEKYLISKGITKADYPLYQPCCNNRWSTHVYERNV